MTIMGYTCTCGKYTQFSAYVLAHWDAELDHVCPQCRSSGYRGICHFCTGEIEYDGQLIVIEIENADLYCLVVPIDIFSCPHCLHTMETMQIWKSVETTSELDALTRSENGTQEKGPAS